MKILFCSGHPFPPQMFGGMQSSMSTLAHHLSRRGHRVSLLCGLSNSGVIALRDRVAMKLTGHPAVRDTRLGYPVWRSWFPAGALAHVAARTKPDLIVVAPPGGVEVGLAVQALGLPLMMWLLDVEMEKHGGDFARLGPVPCIANSNFTAGRYREAFGLSATVIHPLIERKNYLTETSRTNITFINPHAHKGLDIVLAIAAACPDIPFAIYQSWPLSLAESARLNASLAALPNVSLFPPTPDMREAYRKTRILLAPSRWNEAYGRVISEVQFNGIPVIVSNRGGLPETAGPGGIVLDPDAPIADWIAATRRLWLDADYYKQLSTAAALHSARPDIDLDTQLMRWEETLRTALNPDDLHRQS